MSENDLTNAIIRLLRGIETSADIENLRQYATGNFSRFAEICRPNLVLGRTLTRVREHSPEFEDPVDTALTKDRQRVQRGMELIAQVTEMFEGCDIPFMVIKTLDHYPDQGHDIDLFVDEDLTKIDRLMFENFAATAAGRSLCDNLAGKKNYRIRDLTLEVHSGTLGQVGEHKRLASVIFELRKPACVGGVNTFVPAPEGRLILSILQRIYRHFNFRIGDLINIANLLEDPTIDWDKISEICRLGGIEFGAKQGVAMVSDLLGRLGDSVRSTAPTDWSSVQPIDSLVYRRNYFRFALGRVVPQVYSREFANSLWRSPVSQGGRLIGLGMLAPIVAVNIRFAPSVSLWRKLW